MSTRERSSETRLGHDKRDIPAFDTVLFDSNLRSLQRKYLSNPTDKIVLSLGQNHQKGLQKYATDCSKMKKENLISGSSRGYFWQPLIAPEARKARSCQSFSASHIGPRADCPFHCPAFFRPDMCVDPQEYMSS